MRRLEGQGPPAHQVWLPPLDEAPSLDQLLPALAAVPGSRPDRSRTTRRAGGLVVPVGLVDKPFEQRRDLLYRDFSGAAGHMLIVGGPQSGKSTLLRTLDLVVRAHPHPAEVQFYCLDFGGGGLIAMADLPHVGGVASRLDPEKVRRTVAEVAGILNRARGVLPRHNIDSVADLPQRRGRRASCPTSPGATSSWSSTAGAASRPTTRCWSRSSPTSPTRGLGFGVHVVLTASPLHGGAAGAQGPCC